MLPTPVAKCRYWHRNLNPKKLVNVGFSHLTRRMTLPRAVKLYKLPAAPLTPGIRPMEQKDVKQVRLRSARACRVEALVPHLLMRVSCRVRRWLR